MIEHHEPYADHPAEHPSSMEAALPTFDEAAEQIGAGGSADAASANFIDSFGDAAPADLPSGLQLTHAGGSTIDIGEPTLSSTGAEPDSVVTHTSRGAEVYSDLDGDGRVDQIVRVDLGGQVSAWTIGDHGAGDGDWRLVSTGTIDPFGGTTLSPPGIGPAADSLGAAAHPIGADPHPSAAAPPTGPPQVTVPGANGTEFTGPATGDSDGDGVLDTVVVRSADGSVTHASDLDGDGLADRLTVVAADGQVTVSRSDADGNWEVVTTQAADPAQQAGPGHGAVPDDHIAVLDHGEFVDAGAPQFDMNGDGAPETALVERDGVIYQYSDTDGDGRADQLLTVHPDHSASISVDRASGWQVAVHGHIAGDGDFVPADGQRAGEAGQHPGPSEPARPASHRPAAPHVGSPDIELRAPGADAVDLGRPDQDLDGDGVSESVAVRTEDGHVLIVSDTDADGTADRLIDINPESGGAQWMALDAHGQWTRTQHGHVDGSGALVVDGPDRDPSAGPPSGMAGDEQLTVSVDGHQIRPDLQRSTPTGMGWWIQLRCPESAAAPSTTRMPTATAWPTGPGRSIPTAAGARSTASTIPVSGCRRRPERTWVGRRVDREGEPMTTESGGSGGTGSGGAASPISRQSLTALLAALREQHAGAPTVAPLITRAAHPSLRREVPAVLARAVRAARAAETIVPVAGAQAVEEDAGAGPVVPGNLSAVLGLRRIRAT